MNVSPTATMRMFASDEALETVENHLEKIGPDWKNARAALDQAQSGAHEIMRHTREEHPDFHVPPETVEAMLKADEELATRESAFATIDRRKRSLEKRRVELQGSALQTLREARTKPDLFAKATEEADLVAHVLLADLMGATFAQPFVALGLTSVGGALQAWKDKSLAGVVADGLLSVELVEYLSDTLRDFAKRRGLGELVPRKNWKAPERPLRMRPSGGKPDHKARSKAFAPSYTLGLINALANRGYAGDEHDGWLDTALESLAGDPEVLDEHFLNSKRHRAATPSVDQLTGDLETQAKAGVVTAADLIARLHALATTATDEAFDAAWNLWDCGILMRPQVLAGLLEWVAVQADRTGAAFVYGVLEEIAAADPVMFDGLRTHAPDLAGLVDRPAGERFARASMIRDERGGAESLGRGKAVAS